MITNALFRVGVSRRETVWVGEFGIEATRHTDNPVFFVAFQDLEKISLSFNKSRSSFSRNTVIEKIGSSCCKGHRLFV